jgi:hypothetical protein
VLKNLPTPAVIANPLKVADMIWLSKLVGVDHAAHPEALLPIAPEYRLETGPEIGPLFDEGSYYYDRETV